MYAITSPEGAAAILFRDRSRAPEVAEALGVAAADLLALGAIDTVVAEPAGGAHADPDAAIRLLRPALRRAVTEAMRARASQRRARREQRVRAIGVPTNHLTAAILRNIGDALGYVGDAAGHLGSRLLRRSEDGRVEEPSTAAAPPESPEPVTPAGA